MLSCDSSDVGRGERQKLYEWIIGLKHVYGFNDYSTLSALKFFDKFVSQNKLVPVEMHHLIAMTCFGLAVKMNE